MELVVTVCHFPHSTIYFIDCIVHTSRTSQTENSSPLIKTFVVVVFKIFPVGMGSRMKNNPWLSGFGGVLFWLGFFVFSFKCLGKNVFQENHSLFFSHLKMTMSFFSFLSIDSCKIITVFFSSTIQNSFLSSCANLELLQYKIQIWRLFSTRKLPAVIFESFKWIAFLPAPHILSILGFYFL